MPNLILFDTEARDHLLPLTATRPMAELRIGILTIREKWEMWLKGSASFITKEYLHGKFPIHVEYENLLISAGVLPTPSLCRRIMELQMNQALLKNDELIAARLSKDQIQGLIDDVEIKQLEGIPVDDEVELVKVEALWDFLRHNDRELNADYQLLTKGRVSQPISGTNRVLGPENVFLEEGVSMECCIVNALKGPVYIGKNTVVMEGAMLRGPIAIANDVIVKMGAKIYGPTSIGPGCRVGGEITRSILLANSNKAHEGYLGDAVIGEWCNIGADSNNSNLKNNYSEVKLWDYPTARFARTGLQFCGMFMGDHAKCGINTMFNTGTVVGVFANVFGAGYQRNFIPDFSWGGPDSPFRTYKIDEAVATAEAVMARRGKEVTPFESDILRYIFDKTSPWRTWDKS
jgi:UDP-N-acetylglucosamine diphosphorylase/glucosamine-1-phosphate N-acetyltransferase